MNLEKTAPTAWMVTATIGGILFLLGGITTTMSTTPRLVMAGGALAFVILAVYTVSVLRRRDILETRQRELLQQIDRMATADTSLRTRMAYTLRDPLTSIVGFADHMVNSPDLAFDEQREMLIAIRADALEVERALSDLAAVEVGDDHGPPLDGIVLLDVETESIASTIITDAIFESDLTQTRAWGDSAKVRQILRTVLHAATDSGCGYITLKTTERAGRATASISGRDELLSIEAVAALTGNTVAEDLHTDTYRALRSAYELAGSMDGSIGYAEAFGISHIVIDLPVARSDVGITTPHTKPEQPTFELSFATAMDLRPERPTSAIRFG